MISVEKSKEIVRLNPATDAVVIQELVEAGRVLAGELDQVQPVSTHKTADGVQVVPGMTLWIHDKSDYWFEWKALEFWENHDETLQVIYRNHEVTLGYPMAQCYAKLPPSAAKEYAREQQENAR